MLSILPWFIPTLILIFVTITVWIWGKVTISWLNWLASGIILLYPFEYFPTLDIGPATLKPSFILTLVTLWVFAILMMKKDRELLSTTIQPIAYWFTAFYVAQLPSWFVVTDGTRFWTTQIATFGVIFASLIIAHFSKNPVKDIKRLVMVMIGICIFATFQFIGDMIGLPESITQLRENYTKAVFGFPRVHATALEPQLFAGMLFLPIITFILYISSSKKLWFIPEKYVNKLKQIPFFGNSLYANEISKSGFSQLVAFLFITAILIVTISKGAYLALVIILPILMILTMKNINYRPVLAIASIALILAGLALAGLAIKSEKVRYSLADVYGNFYLTILGETGSAVERESFQNVATYLAEKSPITGVGSGNYGKTAAFLLPEYAENNPGALIVNNVYLEMYAELGLFTLLVFISFLGWMIFRSWLYIQTNEKIDEKYLAILATTFALIAYLIQWVNFSPLYITPVFIIIGLLNALFRQEKD